MANFVVILKKKKKEGNRLPSEKSPEARRRLRYVHLGPVINEGGFIK